jgi:hypothetical protein
MRVAVLPIDIRVQRVETEVLARRGLKCSKEGLLEAVDRHSGGGS